MEEAGGVRHEVPQGVAEGEGRVLENGGGQGGSEGGKGVNMGLVREGGKLEGMSGRLTITVEMW